jgi:hypothetical protein
MKNWRARTIRGAGNLPVAAVLCAFFITSVGQAAQDKSVSLKHDDRGLVLFNAGNSPANPPLPLKVNSSGGLDINRETVDRKKLQLQLAYPLTLTMGSTTGVVGNSSQVVGLDATLALPLSQSSAGNMTMTGGVIQQMGDMQFQSLGNIECLNGQLNDYSYTASGCRFVDSGQTNIGQTKIELGSRFDTDNTTSSISWFTQDSSWGSSGARRYNSGNSYSGLNAASLAPLMSPSESSNKLLGPLPGVDSSLSGVDLRFQLGITTDRAGDVRFGLQFTRVLDAQYQSFSDLGLSPNSSSAALPWKLAKPFDSARMNVEWSRGSFSSGIQGYYREPVRFLNRNTLNGATTFDVHFTWRAPWNANLSVGATNVLSAGGDDSPASDSHPADPFESIYGRIPYVRYKQDL